jgi:hypothetical protein
MATSKATTTSIEDAVKIARVFPGEENWCKEYIAAHLLSRTWIQVQLADAVGKMDSEDLTGEIDHYTWFSDLLPAVNWWQDLADNCLHGPDGDGSGGANPKLAKQGENLSLLLSDVLTAYVKAHRESPAYTDDWGNVGPGMMQFLNCYRLYTRAVEAVVVEVFPDVNRELLLNPALGFRSESA